MDSSGKSGEASDSSGDGLSGLSLVNRVRPSGSRTVGAQGAAAEQLRISSVQSLCTEAFPTHLAAVVRCSEPHRSEAEREQYYSWSALEYFLRHWQKMLTGVVFGGSEPLAQPAVADAVARVHARGFAVGLHTAGHHPEPLCALLPQLQWVSLATPIAAGTAVSGQDELLAPSVRASIACLVEQRVPFECNTELRWGLTVPDGMRRLAQALADLGVRNYTVTVSNRIFLPERVPIPVDTEQELELWHELQTLFPDFRRREVFPSMA